jgi:hypothetical protein
MARFDAELQRPVPWSASGLYQAINAFLAQAADSLEGVDAQQMKKASTHWAAALAWVARAAGEGRADAGADPGGAEQLGHASIGATSGYLTSEKESRVAAMRGVWKQELGGYVWWLLRRLHRSTRLRHEQRIRNYPDCPQSGPADARKVPLSVGHQGWWAAGNGMRVSNFEQFIANMLLKLRTLLFEEKTSRVNAW